MTKRFAQLGVALLAFYLLAAAALFAFQRSFFYLPQSLHLSPTDVGVTRTREVRLATADSVHIEAWYSPAPEGQPTLVFFHGNGGLVSAFGDRIRHAQGHGFGIMLVEYRGYAGLSGTPSEEGLYADGRAALDWLAKQGVPSSSVFLYGESLGSGVAVKLASERRVAGVILESPYTSAAAVGELRFWMFPVSWLVWDRYDSLSRIKKIHAPLLVMHGGEDNVIPQSQGRALFDAAVEPKQGYFPPEAHHVDLARYGGENKLDDFIAKFWNARPGAPHATVYPPDRPFAVRCEVYAPPPSEKIESVIKRADRIVLAEVTAVRPNPHKVWYGDNVVYTLKVVETLKGKDQPYVIELPGVALPHAFPIDPMLLDVSHRHEKGLAKAETVDDVLTSANATMLGVVDMPGYCEHAPHFDVGMTYLVLLPDTFTPISFEPVITIDDAWYLRVSKLIGPAGNHWGLY